MKNNIIFPDNYHPSKSAIHVYNELFIPASKEEIWFWLTNVKTWPEWYANASNIEILHEVDTNLNHHTKFNWRTFNTNIQSQVKEYIPYKKLAWVARGKGLVAYHSWLLIPEAEGCTVITEETQRGWLPKWFGFFIKKSLLKQHQIWLEGLKCKATNA